MADYVPKIMQRGASIQIARTPSRYTELRFDGYFHVGDVPIDIPITPIIWSELDDIPNAFSVNSDGHLLVTQKDGDVIDAGLVRGPQGAPGGASSTQVNAVSLTSGSTLDLSVGAKQLTAVTTPGPVKSALDTTFSSKRQSGAMSLGSITPSSAPYPRLASRGTGPILTAADSPAGEIYGGFIIDRWQGNPSVPMAERYAVITSTDHAAGGVYLAVGPSPLSATGWTDFVLVAPGTQTGVSQIETPAVVWNEAENLWFCYVQGIAAAGQATYLMTSPDLFTWTWISTAVMSAPTQVPNISHTGYARIFRIAGTWYAFTLWGQSGTAFWTSSNGRTWRIRPDLLPSGADRCRFLPGFNESDEWLINFAIPTLWNGNLWMVTTAKPRSSGGTETILTRFVSIRLGTDLRSFASDPFDVTPTPQSWEVAAIDNVENFVTLDDGRIVGFARANGKTGGYGLKEMV